MENNETIENIDVNENIGVKENIDVKGAPPEKTLVRNNYEESQNEIDLMDVVHQMGKKRPVFLRLIAIFLLIGFAVPLLLFQFNKPHAQTVSLISFLNDDNSEMYDITYLKSPVIIKDALESCGMSDSLNVDSVAKNISIERLLDDETKQKLQLLSALDLSETNSVKQIAETLTLNYENGYLVRIENGFSDGDSTKKQYIKDFDLERLADAVTTAYNNYLFEHYSDQVVPGNPFDIIDLSDTEYIDVIGNFRSAIGNLKAFCDAKTEIFPNYRSSVDGLSFKDLSTMISTSLSTWTDYSYSRIYYTGAAHDRKTLLDRLESRLLPLQLELTKTEADLVAQKKTIEEYKKNRLVVISPEVQSLEGPLVSSDYYNSLIMRQFELESARTDIIDEIAEVERLIELFSDSTASSTLTPDAIKAEFDLLYEDCAKVYNIVVDHAKELYASETYRSSIMNVLTVQEKTETLSSKFVSALVGAAVGAIAGVVLWIAFGFMATNADNSRKRKAAVSQNDASEDRQ